MFWGGCLKLERLYVVAFLVFINMNILFGNKLNQSQVFLDDGARIPVTRIGLSGNTIIAYKTKEKDGYFALKLGIGIRKHPNSSLRGEIKGANLQAAPRFLREVKLSDEEAKNMPALGMVIKSQDAFKPGDIIDVMAISKGKGFAGVVKRHHFKGGPRTHGQSDRERAPGSIGQTTTPGRVYKGKRMAGRMGQGRSTIKNLRVVEVSDEQILVKGLVPGSKNSLIMIKKVGEDKKFVPLYREKPATTASDAATTEITDSKSVETATTVEEAQNAG